MAFCNIWGNCALGAGRSRHVCELTYRQQTNKRCSFCCESSSRQPTAPGCNGHCLPLTPVLWLPVVLPRPPASATSADWLAFSGLVFVDVDTQPHEGHVCWRMPEGGAQGVVHTVDLLCVLRLGWQEGLHTRNKTRAARTVCDVIPVTLFWLNPL
jgi:hypothetical protein